ncbi:MAG TPA: hypothetical protein PL093_00855 [Candidatus Pacearchaeota archaeon]|jgi:hypothetical protein|nr:hypothetical protein [Candidatus Pacearchaeota archaeon]HRR94658.1 hypothetical protein [Candidatus Paceibacterota bacterium]HPC30517.1 hypothetical protein [Candidatus Pacearchaeota archaeon]HQG09140.1 hypothetical protein [Candidatus Pacearchaeota archaeon]HQH20109.1 hypothetical protein [Candidatus Pacearchaeota archaeon]
MRKNELKNLRYIDADKYIIESPKEKIAPIIDAEKGIIDGEYGE